MGVTIHFEGSLKDETSYQKLVEVVRAFADQHGWSYEENSNYDAVLERFDQEGADVYEGPAKGIVVMPHEDAEPLRFEFDSDLFVQERIKTQFSNVETHILVVTLLKLVRPLFSHLEVSDEGEYYESGDVTRLEAAFESCFAQLDELLQDPDRFEGPIRLEDGSIIDVIAKENGVEG